MIGACTFDYKFFIENSHLYDAQVEIFFRRKQSNWLPHTLAKPSDEIFGKKKPNSTVCSTYRSIYAKRKIHM